MNQAFFEKVCVCVCVSDRPTDRHRGQHHGTLREGHRPRDSVENDLQGNFGSNIIVDVIFTCSAIVFR